MSIATFSHLGSMGELGNQMFQVASTIGYARKHTKNPVFPEWKCRISGRDYSKIFRTSIDQSLRENGNLLFSRFGYHDLMYSDIPYIEGNTDLVGYFQSEKYFMHCEDEIRSLFSPNKDISDYIVSKYNDIVTNTDHVCVHIRTAKRERNDYDVHASCTPEYLSIALSNIDPSRLHVIFADNMQLAKTMLPSDRNYKFIENEENYVDLFLMRYFNEYILSPSTFGWWGAWLSLNKNPSVSIMKNWFDPNKSKSHLNNNDITPDRWQKL